MNDEKAKEKRKLADYSTVGMMFPTSIAVGGVIGYFLDRWLDTAPVFLIILVLYGIAAGFYNLFKVTRQHEKKKKE